MKGQAIQEFAVILCLVLLVFYIFYTLYIGQTTVTRQAGERMAAMRTAAGIQAALNYVYLAGDGAKYNTTFFFSAGKNVTILDGTVWVHSDTVSYSVPLLTTRVNASELEQGEVAIRNEAGWISID